MYFIPLTQVESVDLVVHALRAAAGQADCSMCPVRKVCMQQCLTIAGSIEELMRTGALPQLNPPDPEPPAGPKSTPGGASGHQLRVVK